MLLNSEWMRAVQFKCNTSAKSVTPMQITPYNYGLLVSHGKVIIHFSHSIWINLLLQVFQKAEIVLSEVAHAISI